MTNEQPGEGKRVLRAYKVFFEAIQEDSIHSLVRAAAEFWGYGVLVTDENYYLVSQYPNQRIGDPVWDTLYEHKVLSQQIIQSFQQMYLVNESKTYEPFYADRGLVGDFPRIFAEIYTEDRILGHIGIFLMGNELQEDDLRITQILVDALRMKMSRANGYMPSLSTYLSDLLRPDVDAYLKEWAIEALEGAVTKSYVIMVTPVGQKAAQKAFAEYSVSQITRVYRNAVSIMHGDSIVSLFGEMGGEHKRDKEAAFLNKAAEFMTKIHAVSGISETFNDLVQTPYLYQQALLTSKLSQKRIGFYRDFAPAPLYLYVAQQTDARAFIHAALFKLSDYDKDNHTHYFDTLREYCFSMHNMEAASKALYIHRNTLAYRLNRIEELFGIAFEDNRIARYLLSSFELWDMLRD